MQNLRTTRSGIKVRMEEEREREMPLIVDINRAAHAFCLDQQ